MQVGHERHMVLIWRRGCYKWRRHRRHLSPSLNQIIGRVLMRPVCHLVSHVPHSQRIIMQRMKDAADAYEFLMQFGTVSYAVAILLSFDALFHRIAPFQIDLDFFSGPLTYSCVASAICLLFLLACHSQIIPLLFNYYDGSRAVSLASNSHCSLQMLQKATFIWFVWLDRRAVFSFVFFPFSLLWLRAQQFQRKRMNDLSTVAFKRTRLANYQHPFIIGRLNV